jgi:hypothetical protein
VDHQLRVAVDDVDGAQLPPEPVAAAGKPQGQLPATQAPTEQVEPPRLLCATVKLLGYRMSMVYAEKIVTAINRGTAWSEGGQSTLANCEMLCITRNRAKGNR